MMKWKYIALALVIFAVTAYAATTVLKGSESVALRWVNAYQENVAVATTNTTLINRLDVDSYNECTVNVYNGNSTQPVYVHWGVSNKDLPGTSWSDADYADLGMTTVAASSSEAIQVAGNYRWMIIFSSAAITTTDDVDAYVRCSR